MKKIILVFTIFIILMEIWQLMPSNKQLVTYPRALQKRHEKIIKKLPLKEQRSFRLLASFVAGDPNLSGLLKSPYRKLGLIHLMTPSGFHLQLIFFLFAFFKLKRIKKFALISLLGIFFLPGFEALKRVIVLRLLGSFHQKLPKNLSSPFCQFLVVFLLFLIFGDYARNPLSFSMSFLFLGIIYSMDKYKNGKFYLAFWIFFGAQLLIQFYLPTKYLITIPQFFYGLVLGLIFNFLFIIFIPIYFIMLIKPYVILLKPVGWFHSWVLACSQNESHITSFGGALIIIILISGLFFNLFKNRKIALRIIATVVLLISSPLNLEIKKKSSHRWKKEFSIRD